METVVITIFAVTFIILLKLLGKSRQERLLDALPGPAGHPLIGNYLDILQIKQSETCKSAPARIGKCSPIWKANIFCPGATTHPGTGAAKFEQLTSNLDKLTIKYRKTSSRPPWKLFNYTKPREMFVNVRFGTREPEKKKIVWNAEPFNFPTLSSTNVFLQYEKSAESRSFVPSRPPVDSSGTAR